MSLQPASAQQAGASEKPFEIPAELSHFSVSMREYLEHHTQYQQLAVGALVFDGNRLLLVQRAASERAFPNRWEVPGGSVDPEDETIVHAVARELEEETGLHVTALTQEIGTGVEFRTGTGLGRKSWLKLAFEVVVAEQEGGLRAKKEGSGAGDAAALGRAEALPIRLDPVEHQHYLWATEDDVRRGQVAGTRLEFPTPEQEAMVLEAFRLRRARE